MNHLMDHTQPQEMPEGTKYVGLEHIPRRDSALQEWDLVDKVSSGKSQFLEGDTLFGKLRPYFHKVVPAPISGVCSTDILVVRATEPTFSAFVFGHLFSDALVAHATAASDGTKMPRTKWKDLIRHQFAVPPQDVAARYQEIAGPLLARIRANIHSSRTLAELRDALLPKLISGEIRVPEAEGFKKAEVS